MPHLKTRNRTKRNLRSSCRSAVNREIRKETLANKRKPISERISRKQVVAIGFSKARNKNPKCRKILMR